MTVFPFLQPKVVLRIFCAFPRTSGRCFLGKMFFLANSQTLFVLCTEILKHWLPTSPRKILVLANAYFFIFNQSNLTHLIPPEICPPQPAGIMEVSFYTCQSALCHFPLYKCNLQRRAGVESNCQFSRIFSQPSFFSSSSEPSERDVGKNKGEELTP